MRATELDGDDEIDATQRVTELQDAMMKLIKEGVGEDAVQRDAKFKALADEIKALRDRQRAKSSEQAGAENRRSQLNEMITVLEDYDYSLDEYNDGLVRLMVEQIRVLDSDKVLVSFGLGVEYICELRDGAAK